MHEHIAWYFKELPQTSVHGRRHETLFYTVGRSVCAPSERKAQRSLSSCLSLPPLSSSRLLCTQPVVRHASLWASAAAAHAEVWQWVRLRLAGRSCDAARTYARRWIGRARPDADRRPAFFPVCTDVKAEQGSPRPGSLSAVHQGAARHGARSVPRGPLLRATHVSRLLAVLTPTALRSRCCGRVMAVATRGPGWPTVRRLVTPSSCSSASVVLVVAGVPPNEPGGGQGVWRRCHRQPL